MIWKNNGTIHSSAVDATASVCLLKLGGGALAGIRISTTRLQTNQRVRGRRQVPSQRTNLRVRDQRVFSQRGATFSWPWRPKIRKNTFKNFHAHLNMKISQNANSFRSSQNLHFSAGEDDWDFFHYRIICRQCFDEILGNVSNEL